MAVSHGVSPTARQGRAVQRLALFLLALQTSALYLILHYSRIMPLVNGHRYFPSTAVLMNEVIKLSLSITIAMSEIAAKNTHLSALELLSNLFGAVISHDSWKMALPAILYTLQNTLLYVAASNLDASTFHITYQLRLLAIAVSSAWLLKRSLTSRQKLSLLLLVVGIALVQWPIQTLSPLRSYRLGTSTKMWITRSLQDAGFEWAGRVQKRSASYQGIEEEFALHNPIFNPANGFLAAAVASATSGVAGVYFERILVTATPASESRYPPSIDVWIRNVQLSLFSIFPALFVGVMFVDGDRIARAGFFAGYNWIVWLAIGLQAFGGMIVAAVLSHANNAAKTFATSVAIVSSFVGSVVFFDLDVTFSYAVGTLSVLASIWLYSREEKRRSAPTIVVPVVHEPEQQDGPTPKLNPDAFDSIPMPTAPMSTGASLTTSRPQTPSGLRQKSRSPSKGRRPRE